MPLNPARLGFRYRPYRYEVGRETVRAYAAATFVEDPRYHFDDLDDPIQPIPVPPAFVACIAGARAWDQLMGDAELGAHGRLMHVGQELDFDRPVNVGDVLICTPEITDLRAARGLELLTLQVACASPDGAPIVVSRSRLMFLSRGSAEAPARVSPEAKFLSRGSAEAPARVSPSRGDVVTGGGGAGRAAELSLGQQLPERSVMVDQAALIRYAGVSEDFNPLHWDAAFASSVSPTGGVIAHGMLSMGLLSAQLTDWLADAGRVCGMACQFKAPVPVGVTVTLGGEVVEVDEAVRTATLRIWARTGDGAKVIDQRVSRAVVAR